MPKEERVDRNSAEEDKLSSKIASSAYFIKDSMAMAGFLLLLGLSSIAASVFFMIYAHEPARSEASKMLGSFLCAVTAMAGTSAMIFVGAIVHSLLTEEPSIPCLFRDQKKLAALRKRNETSSQRGS